MTALYCTWPRDTAGGSAIGAGAASVLMLMWCAESSISVTVQTTLDATAGVLEFKSRKSK